MIANASSDGSPESSTQPEKRKAEDRPGGSQSHTRSKRNRYISIACNECKRRKIKCNGQTPCHRCGNLNLDCVYAPNCCTNSLKDSAEFQQMRDHISALQDQVNELFAQLNDLRARQDGGLPPAPDPIFHHDGPGRSLSASRTLPPLVSPKRPSQRVLPQFHGPTSSAYGFDVAKSSLQTMGITNNMLDEGLMSRDRSRAASPLPASPHSNKDPLWLIDAAEVGRLCRIYEEEIGIMYPVVDIERVQKHASGLYKFIGASLRSGFGNPSLPGSDAFDDEDTVVLKMVLAITLVVEGSGRSELGERFFESAKPAVDLRLVTNTGVLSVALLVLTATYYFQKDKETQAWRFIGIAARICIEMGLHRRDSLIRTFTNEAEYQQAVRVFWIVYALDRRWSFGTGMPFALQDADIDSSLPEPVGKFCYHV
jgi:Fungal specific transcription factor domain/Fungal Zn(2)-Cys(6) binuclear cluster domain